MIRGVPVEELEAIWPKVAPLLEDSLERADEGVTLEEVFDQLKHQKSMLWVNETMAMVLTTENGALFAWLLGGSDFDAWADEVNAAMKRYAHEMNLRYCKSVVRPGLAKKLRSIGWKTTAEYVRTEL